MQVRLGLGLGPRLKLGLLELAELSILLPLPFLPTLPTLSVLPMMPTLPMMPMIPALPTLSTLPMMPLPHIPRSGSLRERQRLDRVANRSDEAPNVPLRSCGWLDESRVGGSG